MSVYKKLNDARTAFHALKLKKSGRNTFAGYDYFELADFLIPGMQVLAKHGLCAVVSFGADVATMTIAETDGDGTITITSPMGSAALKGCHEVQNIGAVETYQRRYLWMAALEIVEHDALDATTGKAEPATRNEPVIDDSQFSELQTLIESTGTDIKAFCTFYKIQSVNALPVSKFEHASASLKSKLEKRKAA